MNEIDPKAETDLDQLKKKALLFVWIGEIWNLLEAGVALWSGVAAASVALIGFGLDSILELAAGAILIWRLQTEWQDNDEESTAERKAHKLVGITFFVLAGYILVQSIATPPRLLSRASRNHSGSHPDRRQRDCDDNSLF